MLEGEFARVLTQWGQKVRVYTKKEPDGISLRAFIQPMREKGTEQTVPSPLGQVKQDRFVYLGPPETELDEESKVELDGMYFRVWSAQPVSVGNRVSHWWAVLTRRAWEVAE